MQHVHFSLVVALPVESQQVGRDFLLEGGGYHSPLPARGGEYLSIRGGQYCVLHTVAVDTRPGQYTRYFAGLVMAFVAVHTSISNVM